MSEQQSRFQFTIRQVFSSVFWLSAGFGAAYWSNVAGASALRSPQSAESVMFGLAWIGLLGAGAAMGAAIASITGRQLLWAIIGIFTWPVAVIAWDRLISG